MANARPISIEFVMGGKQKLTADFSQAVDAMSDKLTAGMGAAVARVETALAKLNKVGMPAWDQTAANAGVAAMVANINKASAAVDDYQRKARAAGLIPTTGAAPRTTSPASPSRPATSITSTTYPGTAQTRTFNQIVQGNPVLAQAYASAGGASSSALATFSQFATGVGSSIYILKSLGAAIDGYLVAPLKEFGAALMEVTDENRKFELSIAGVVGGMDKARAVNDAIHRAVRDVPLTIHELQEAARGASYIPALGSRMAAGNLAETTAQVKEYATLLQRLAILNPEQGVKGAGIALREAMAGEFRSIRTRFDVAPEQIARTIGKSLDELARDPALTLKAVNTFASIFAPDEAVTAAGKLYSVRVEKLKDQLSAALRQLGNADIYDDVVRKLESFERQLFDYFQGDRFKAQAKRMSAALSDILDNATRAVGAFLQAATGQKADSIGGIVEGFTRLVERLADVSKGLIPIGENIGAMVGKIAGALGTLDNQLGRFGEFEPGNMASRITKGLLFDDSMSLEDMRRAAVSGMLQNAGLAAPGILYAPAASPYEVYRSGGGVSGYMGQIARNLYGSGVGGYGEAVPYLDFARYGPKVALAAQNLQRAVDSLDEPTLRNPGALAAAVKEAIGKVYGALGKSGTSTTPDLDTVIKREGLVYNFGAEASGAVQLLGRVSSLRNSERDPLRKLLAQAGGTFATNLGTDREPFTVADIFKRLDAAYGRESDTYIKAMEQATNPGQASQVRGDFEKLTGRYQNVRKQLADQLVGTAQDFGVALADSIKDLPPNVRGAMLDRIADGTTSFADKVKDVLVSAGEDAAHLAARLSYNELPLRDRLAIQSARVGAKVAGIEQGYTLPVGASADDIVSTVARGPAAPVTIARRLADFLGNDPRGLAENVRLYNQARDQFNPKDEGSVLALAQAQDALVNVVARLKEAKDAADVLKQSFVEFGQAVEKSMEDSLGNAIYNLISGTGTLKDALLGFANDVTRAFSQMAARNLMAKVFGDDSQAAGGKGIDWVNLIGGMLGLSKGSGSGGKFSGGSFGASSGGADFAANGAVWDGGFTPVAMFAQGGVVNRPVLGIIGEGAYPEAVIPMPNGRSVQAHITGMPQQGNIYVVANFDEAVRQGFKQHKDDIVDITVADVKKGGKLGRTLRRRAGS